MGKALLKDAILRTLRAADIAGPKRLLVRAKDEPAAAFYRQHGFEPVPDHRGLASRLHGGLVATALDEIMVWAGILLEGVMSVTGTMEVRFRSPVPVDQALTLGGSVTERRGRRLRLAGEVRTDRVHAEASGLYLVTESIEEMLA